jgi:hypothetical protein
MAGADVETLRAGYEALNRGVKDGEIVEDWAASDNLQLIRQLGPWRLLALAVAWLRQKRQACRA